MYPRFRSTLEIGAVVAGLLAGASGLLAQTGQTIKEIRIVGQETVPESVIRGQLRSAVGRPYDSNLVEEDRRRILATGRVLDVQAAVVEQADGILLTFEVSERPVVRELRFSGNRKFDEKKLREAVPLKEGDPIDLFVAREGRAAIVDLYREKGYGSVAVELDEDAARRGELVYVIEEGPRVRIRKILFEGAAAFTPFVLQGRITSNTYLWIFRDGKFDVDTVESDAAAIQNFYRDEGYLDARAGYRLEFDDAREKLTLVFVIAEGVRYTLESLTVEGNTVYTTEELTASLLIKPGDYLRRPTMERDVRAVAARYHDAGYIYAEVEPVRAFSEAENQAAVTLKITEGERFTVGRIVVRGNSATKDKVVRRELDLFPEDLFNLSKLRQAEQELQATQIFSAAKVSPVGEEETVRDVVMDVTESGEAANLVFGVGVTSNSGLQGSIVLDIKNFDLFDTPRSFSEFIKGRAFHGAGQRLRIEAQPGTELSRFRVDFTEPYLFDLPVNFGTSAYYFVREREVYEEERLGGNVSFGRRLMRGFLKGWYGEVAFRGESIDISDLDLLAPREIRDDRGSSTLTSVKLALAKDRTDHRFLPSRGDVWRFAWEQAGALGGDHAFGKFTAGYTWYKTLHTDDEERKHILALRGSVGAIVGDAPVFERFYGGGIPNLRGFEFRGVSPRAGLTDEVIGGDFQVLAGAEYSFPLFADTLRGVVFTDMGTIEEGFEISSWRGTVGVGLRLIVDMFGRIPMEFDFAVPYLSDEEDEEQVFSFSIGLSF